jgi:HopA1 effector protein family
MNTSEVLKYIAQHLSIDHDFTLRLPDEPDFTVSAQIVQRLQASSRDLQASFLQDQLQTFLIDRYFSRSLESTATEDFANDNGDSIHSEFYQSLEQANPCLGYYDWSWTIEEILADDSVRVVQDGLHLQMPGTHVYPPEARAVGDEVAIAMPKNLLTVDRYIMVSDRGRPQNSPITFGASGAIANIYFHIPAATATLLLTQLANGLNQAEVLFEVALLIDEAAYPRSDAAILRIDRSAYAIAEAVLRSVYLKLKATALDPGNTGIPPTPLGTKLLAPGVAVAEVATLAQDFGSVFWGAVAKGLAGAWGDELELEEQRWKSIQTALAAVGIDILHTHRITTEQSVHNGDEDIYRAWQPN